jgi:tRNA modification GTPase
VETRWRHEEVQVRPPHELIVAPASVAAASLRAIVRLAGVDVVAMLDAICEPHLGGWPHEGSPPRCVRAALCEPRLAAAFGRVPCEVIIWPGPAGPLGGPLAEIQLPGVTPLVESLVETVCRLGGRLARGGEFTLRSFLAGRIDLLQAEAVLAVIDARSPEQLAEALDAAGGGIGRRLEATRERLLDVLADVEAMIDFGEEAAAGQPMDAIEQRLAGRIDELLAELAGLSAWLDERSAVVSAGMPRVVVTGAANIGKSSLFNALAGHAASIVADVPGTTRDWVQAEIDGPIPFLLVDLAGFEAGQERREAVEVAQRERSRADVVIDCRDASSLAARRDGDHCPRAGGDEPQDAANLDTAEPLPTIPVWTRVDRVDRQTVIPGDRLATSGRTGEGVEQLRTAIGQQLQRQQRDGLSATVRMATALAAAHASLAAGHALLASGHAFDETLLAADLGRGLRHLDEAVGRELGNDLLDRLFARHCIGK